MLHILHYPPTPTLPPSLSPAEDKVAVKKELPGLSLQAIKDLFVSKMFNKYNAVNKAFRTFRGSSNNDGSILTYADIARAFTDLNISLTKSQESELCKWFDVSQNGHVTYADFNKVLGPIILPHAKDQSNAMRTMEATSGAQDGLTFNPTARLGNNRPWEVREKERQDAVKIVGDSPAEWAKVDEPDSWEQYARTFRGTAGFAPVSPQVGGASEGFMPPNAVEMSASPLKVETRGGGGGGGAPAAPLAPIDLNKLEERLRKALGRGWVHAAADIKKAVGVARGSGVSAETVRDLLAERSVPMTSREAAALAQRYASPTGGIDADKMLTHVFKASFAGAAPTKPARVTAPTIVKATALPPTPIMPTAFVKGATKKNVSIF